MVASFSCRGRAPVPLVVSPVSRPLPGQAPSMARIRLAPPRPALRTTSRPGAELLPHVWPTTDHRRQVSTFHVGGRRRSTVFTGIGGGRWGGAGGGAARAAGGGGGGGGPRPPPRPHPPGWMEGGRGGPHRGRFVEGGAAGARPP